MSTPRIRTDVARKFAGGSLTKLGQLFDPPITKGACWQWGTHLPDDRVLQLMFRYPLNAADLVRDSAAADAAEAAAASAVDATHGA